MVTVSTQEALSVLLRYACFAILVRLRADKTVMMMKMMMSFFCMDISLETSSPFVNYCLINNSLLYVLTDQISVRRCFSCSFKCFKIIQSGFLPAFCWTFFPQSLSSITIIHIIIITLFYDPFTLTPFLQLVTSVQMVAMVLTEPGTLFYQNWQATYLNTADSL